MKMVDLPLYIKIANDLRGQIISGRLLPGEMMSSENTLADKYKTSRVTVRKALGVLENEDFVSPWQGKGYFIRKPAHQRYTLIFDDNSPADRARVHQITISSPNQEIKDALQMEPSRKVVLIQRLLLKKGKPAVVDEKYLPYDRGQPIVEKEIQFADFPELVQKKLPSFAITTDMEISAKRPPESVSSLLGCPRGEPILLVRRIMRDQKGRPVALGLMYFHSDHGLLTASSGFNPNR